MKEKEKYRPTIAVLERSQSNLFISQSNSTTLNDIFIKISFPMNLSVDF